MLNNRRLHEDFNIASILFTTTCPWFFFWVKIFITVFLYVACKMCFALCGFIKRDKKDVVLAVAKYYRV